MPEIRPFPFPLSLMLTLALISCGGNSKTAPTTSIPADGRTTTVYVAGSEADGAILTGTGTGSHGTIFQYRYRADVAKYWKDGTSVSLTDGTNSAWANSIVVSGGEVYVGGRDNVGKIWKNGTAVPLGTQSSSVESIVFSGGDMYAAGWQYTNTGKCCIATYWENGIAVPLTSEKTVSNALSTSESYAHSIVVSRGDVYVAGQEVNYYGGDGASIVTYWKNGTPVHLTNADWARANGIAVSGSDVYVAGEESGPTSEPESRYWKNGAGVSLAGPGSSATSITVSGRDVYVAGYEKRGDLAVAAYWKNGTPVHLTDGTHWAMATAIAISGGDVYVAGCEQTGTMNPDVDVDSRNIAKYWKNGTAISLTDGTHGSCANSIFIDIQ